MTYCFDCGAHLKPMPNWNDPKWFDWAHAYRCSNANCERPYIQKHSDRMSGVYFDVIEQHDKHASLPEYK